MMPKSSDRIHLVNWNFDRNGGLGPEPGVLPELCREAYEFLAQLEADWIGMPELVEGLRRQTVQPLAKWTDQPLLPMPALLSRQQFVSMGPDQPLLVPSRVSLAS
jgi:hypothetical protein